VRPSLRFLALVMVGWGGLRATTLGMVPGSDMFRVERKAQPPPIVPTQFPSIEPIDTATAPIELIPGAYPQPPPAPAPATIVRSVIAPIYYAEASSPVLRARAASFPNVRPTPAPPFYPPNPALDEWPLSRFASSSQPPRSSTVIAPQQSLPVLPKRYPVDRVQLTMWALLRSQQPGVAPTPSLASGGTLGASQAGSRLSYNFTRQIAATLRATSEVGRRGSEIAAGGRVQPIRTIPLWFTAERRQRLGGSGRNDFALFFETGVYNRPMPWRFVLDAYLQGGVVGIKHSDGFIDGGMAMTRPVYSRFSAGFGVWGGAQPGVARLDVGPRVTMRVRKTVKVHFDWRQKIAGNARPGSGPAVTLAGDF